MNWPLRIVFAALSTGFCGGFVAAVTTNRYRLAAHLFWAMVLTILVALTLVGINS
jgi:hypothetical protein